MYLFWRQIAKICTRRKKQLYGITWVRAVKRFIERHILLQPMFFEYNLGTAVAIKFIPCNSFFLLLCIVNKVNLHFK